MKKTTKKYVEYLYPGLIVSETSNAEIRHKDSTKVEVPNYAVGFRFYEQEFVVDGEEQFVGKIKNQSNWYYVGKRLTLDEVKKRFCDDSKYDVLIGNMERNHINSVCMTNYGNFMPMKEHDVTLEEYILEYHKEKEALKMFSKLKEHVGEKISYKAWWYGSLEKGTSTLKAIHYFQNIETEELGIPFIGYGAAISSIVLEETGEELYSNPYIEKGYDRRKAENIEDSKRKLFGSFIVAKQKDRRIKAEEISKKQQECADLEAKKKKYKIIRDGLTLVKKETTEEWMQYADNNTNDAYSCCIAETSLLCLKKLQEEGSSFEDVEQIYHEMGLTGFMETAVSSTIAHFSLRGNEFRKYWNKKYGIDEDEKCVANPAILTIHTKR